MWRVVRKQSIDQMITRSFDQGENADGQNKTMWPKGTGHSNAIRAAVQRCWRWCDIQQKNPILLRTKIGGWQSRYRSRWSDCQNPKSVDGKVADENVFTTDGKGICRSSWRKCIRCPRRLRVPSLNKIAQTVVRPSSLYGNFAQRIVSGI